MIVLSDALNEKLEQAEVIEIIQSENQEEKLKLAIR
jgi:hypothetical protein